MKAKICGKCRLLLGIRHFTKDSRTKDGLRNWCKACKKRWAQSDRGKLASKIASIRFKESVGGSAKYYQKYGKAARLRYCYNLTLKQYKDMYVEQNGCCLLCRKPIPYEQICVDHNHETGKIRGLLCKGCNSRLGWVENNYAIILDYLER